jgi:hypothetical protein
MRNNGAGCRADKTQQELEDIIGCGECGDGGWVPAERYEESMAISKKLKEIALTTAESEEERAEVSAHWPFDDRDEEEYM